MRSQGERERESRLWGSASVGGEGAGLQFLGSFFLVKHRNGHLKREEKKKVFQVVNYKNQPRSLKQKSLKGLA